MKYLYLLFSFIILIGFIITLNTCKKDELVKVTKLEIGSETNVTETTASVTATFIDVSANVIAFGFCYATSSTPTVSDKKTANSGTAKKGDFSGNLTGLTANTKYFVRAYALEGDKGVYSSNEVSFTTGAYQLPIVTTSAITVFNHNSATMGGNVTSDAGSDITDRGVYWSTSPNPTTANEYMGIGAGTGAFNSNITGLTPNINYYVCAYATNVGGTAYGSEIQFTTAEAPYVNITSPTTGDHWLGLELENITWTSNIMGNVSISLYNADDIVEVIDGNYPNSNGNYTWNPISDGLYGVNYKIRITSLEINGFYAESEEFKISESNGSTGSLVGIQKTYQTIKIGYQWWMAENLREREYADGTNILEVQPNTNWASLGSIDKAYCYYNNNPTNRDTYGHLYTWSAAMNGENSSNLNPSGIQGVCPNGWHLPSDEEWKELEMYLGISELEVNNQGFRGTNEGSKLAGDADLWEDGNLENDTEFGLSGFSALPGGHREAYSGVFGDLSTQAYWWNSTLVGYDANNRALLSDYTTVYRYWDGSKPHGYSVRCVCD